MLIDGRQLLPVGSAKALQIFAREAPLGGNLSFLTNISFHLSAIPCQFGGNANSRFICGVIISLQADAATD
ncbi:hypothetical protein HJB99_27170 [Rhizobium sp. NLR17b]|uniref:hypothetical protein n=1 Tax=unclassified Rhizobium TaxID=2613769 RepID=UPI001C8390B8|nr:hypothetical protein [Rhizobium sp. NLR17b]MBX5272309.1 hypothetical protein [Rhizobium sp. NLR17b]